MNIPSIKREFPAINIRILLTLLFAFLLAPLQQYLSGTSGKVVDFGDKLPNYIKDNPHKGWLIKFYAPWCYNCQQIGKCT